MTKQINEAAWNPVQFGQNSRGHSITQFTHSSRWYNNIMDSGGERYQVLKRYCEADCRSVEINRALDVIQEDVSACNADLKDIFNIEYDEDSKATKTQTAMATDALQMWAERTKFNEEFFDRVRKTLKFGATFYLKNQDGTISELPTERFIGYTVDKTDENSVTHYIYDPSLPRFDRPEMVRHTKNQRDMGVKLIDVDDLLIMKVGDGPFGQSIIERVYRTWKQMSLLEDSVVVYRVVRAPERRIYYIDTGNLQGPRRDKAINEQRIRLMQKRVNRGGEVESEYDPHSAGEDIFIPTNANGRGSRVETLPGGQSLGELTDLQWFSNKLAQGLRIPQSMIDPQSQEQNQFNDMRVGQIYQLEMRYMGHITRIQNKIRLALAENFEEFCENRGFRLTDDATFTIAQAQSFSLYKEMELNQSLLNIYQSTTQIPQLSKRGALKTYLNMDMESIRNNEHDKLAEMGIPPEKIKELPDHVIANLVYGDGRLQKEHGIEIGGAGQQGGFY